MIKKRIKFEEARAHPELRQAYLNQFLQFCPKSVERIIYYPDWDEQEKEKHFEEVIAEKYAVLGETVSKQEIEEEALEAIEEINDGESVVGLAAMTVLFSHVDTGKKAPILVLANSFDGDYGYKSESHFLNALFDHETVHTDQQMHGITLYYQGKPEININKDNRHQFFPDFLQTLEELLAYRNQLNAFLEQRPSRIQDFFYIEDTIYGIKDCESELKCYLESPASDLERKAIQLVLNDEHVFGGAK